MHDTEATQEQATEPSQSKKLSIDTSKPPQASGTGEGTLSDKASARSFAMKALNVVIVVVAAIVLAYLIRFFVITPYEIPSGSMLDTIQIEDKVMSERLSYYFGEPQPGDIVTFQDPQQPDRTLIKRVIATEGQTIDFQDGDVYVDGEKLDEPYLREGSYTEPLYEHPDGIEHIAYPYTVPEGHVWVMGDNRLESADSRYFGAIDADTVSGHAVFRYWPLDRLGSIG